MKFWLICPLLCILIIFSISTDAMSESTHVLEIENRLLESELKLAKKPQIYFIFDLKNRVIFLKSRGITFKELEIEDFKFWGYPLDIRSYTLLKKSTFFKPKREKIKPRKPDKPEKFEIKALELDDMPTNYRLTFDEGIIVSVKAKPDGIISTLSSTVHRIKWYLSRPLLTLWNYIRSKPFTAIYITLKKEDVRSLYWYFPEGTEGIIYNPS